MKNPILNSRSAPPPAGTAEVPAELYDQPKSGELNIKEKRSWKTWQLLTAVIVAAVVGMWINGDTGGGSSASGGSTTSGTLPPEGSGSSTGSSTGASTGATTTTAPSSGSGTTTTTAAGGASTTTTAAGGANGSSGTTATTAPAAAAGPARQLLLSPQQTGNWTSSAFTTTVAGWNIGWAFRCAPAPAAGPSFQVFVTPAGSAASGTPAISETGPSGQSVTSESSLGSQTLVVEAPASCTWIVKVTGS